MRKSGTSNDAASHDTQQQPARPHPGLDRGDPRGRRYGLAGAMTIAKQATTADFDWD
jgi:hypothetical protein